MDGGGALSTAFILVSDNSTWVATSDATREKAQPSLVVALSEADHLDCQVGARALYQSVGDGLDPRCTSVWRGALNCSQRLSFSEQCSVPWTVLWGASL